MIKKSIIVLFSLSLTVLLGILYKKNASKNDLPSGYKIEIRNLTRAAENINKINFIKSIFYNIEETKKDTNYIMIYSDFSCKGCIHKGKRLVNNIKPYYTLHLSNRKVFNIHDFNKKYFVCNDNIYYYLKKINYIKTPIIIKYDSTYTVLDAFWPGVNHDSEFKKFIE